MGLGIWVAKFAGKDQRCDAAQFRAYVIFELVHEHGHSREVSTAYLDEFACRDCLASSFCPIVDKQYNITGVKHILHAQ